MSGRAVGDRGEALARRYLEGRGYGFVEGNYRTPYGEVDLILLDGETLVFVEVKLRKDSAYGGPLEAVTPRKQARLRLAAEQYLADLADSGREVPPARFDVVGIYRDVGDRTAKVRHVRDAF